MNLSWAMGVLSGDDRGIAAAALRCVLRLAEAAYAQAMNLRNLAYSRGIVKIHALPRPTISVGNLTTGGTGKTPVVCWLAEQMIARRLRPAVLMRGYRGDEAGSSDEQKVLAEALGRAATVVAKPNRVAGSMTAMRAVEQPDVFLLDDGFQHRRVARDFDLVLIDATGPFGFGHVLPRGLLREPVRGLVRADAVLVTRSDLATSQQLHAIEARVRRYVPAGAVYFGRHVLKGLRTADGAALPLEELSRQPFFAFAGIANPAALRRQLISLGRCIEFVAMPDHHAYTKDELAELRENAGAGGAQLMVTTEKDWVKVRGLSDVTSGLPIVRLDLRLEFRDGDEQRLLDQIFKALQPQQGLKVVSSSSRRG
jgi:tetraacyldisaccharide 4'-kinase